MKRLIFLGLLLTIGLTACSPTPVQPMPGAGIGQGMGPGGGMMARHMARIPDEYAGQTSAIPANEESLKQGEEIYTTNCATCHGDGGMGDGPAGKALDPAPAPVSHTSQMMGDDYLFWRISEGGTTAPFNSAMPPWKQILNEQARWDVINYIRALGAGEVAPRQQAGGAKFDPAMEDAQRAEMLAQAIEQRVITQAEADIFNQVHDAMDAYRVAHMQDNFTGNMADIRTMMLPEMVSAGEITQAQADAFVDIQNRLLESELMQ